MNGHDTRRPQGAPVQRRGPTATHERDAGTSRLDVEVRPCLSQLPPEAPLDLTRLSPSPDLKHLHEWGHLALRGAGELGGRDRVEVRGADQLDGRPSWRATRRRSSRELPAQAATSKTDGLADDQRDKQPSGAAIDRATPAG
jgi:hypothetical protein